jgi:hypothetical protein
MEPDRLEALPEELLAGIVRKVGVEAMKPQLRASSRLHKAWQRAVERLRIGAGQVGDADLATISKYTSLRALSLIKLGATDAVAWRIVGCLAPRLPRLPQLEALVVRSCYDTFGLLRTIPLVGLGSRLQRLQLEEWDARLRTIMLYPALRQLTALSSLELLCGDLQLTDAAELRSACGQLRCLRELKLATAATLQEPLLAILPGSLSGLTRLKLYTCAPASQPQPQPLAAAVSGLFGLEELTTSYVLEDPSATEAAQAASQMAVLGRLTSLTSLDLLCSPSNATLAPPVQLQRLRRLVAPLHSLAQLPLQHPALEDLELVLFHDIPSSWRGRVAQGCQLQTLRFHSEEELTDLLFQNLPTLPRLRCLSIREVQPGQGGRFLHLADVLRRHAPTLETIRLNCTSAWQEALPRELPVCKDLGLLGGAVSWQTLQLLSCCSLPRLETLTLQLSDTLAVAPEADLGWLRELQQLKVFCMYSLYGAQLSGSDHALREALREMLPQSIELQFS